MKTAAETAAVTQRRRVQSRTSYLCSGCGTGRCPQQGRRTRRWVITIASCRPPAPIGRRSDFWHPSRRHPYVRRPHRPHPDLPARPRCHHLGRRPVHPRRAGAGAACGWRRRAEAGRPGLQPDRLAGVLDPGGHRGLELPRRAHWQAQHLGDDLRNQDALRRGLGRDRLAALTRHVTAVHGDQRRPHGTHRDGHPRPGAGAR